MVFRTYFRYTHKPKIIPDKIRKFRIIQSLPNSKSANMDKKSFVHSKPSLQIETSQFPRHFASNSDLNFTTVLKMKYRIEFDITIINLIVEIKQTKINFRPSHQFWNKSNNSPVTLGEESIFIINLLTLTCLFLQDRSCRLLAS